MSAGRWLCLAALLLACTPRSEPGAASRAAEAPRPAPAVRYYCPMHPSYSADRPGECPICGMALVRAQGAEDKAHPSAGAPPGYAPIQIDASRQQLLGLRLHVARRGLLRGELRAPGRLVFDETRVHHVHTRFDAYVEDLYASFTGQYVHRGEALLSLYSPDLLAAQMEYLLALRGQRAAAPVPAANPEGAPAVAPRRGGVLSGALGAELVESARQRLLLWNISPLDIEALGQSGEPRRSLKLYSPISGFIVGKTAVHGMRVKPEDALFDIVDVSHLWVLAEVPEQDLPRLRLGQSATVTLPYWPGRSWRSRVSYLYPALDPRTRTLRVRLECDNERGELKAEMLADVRIQVAPQRALLVPEEAVLASGERSLVFVASGPGPGFDGRLQPRAVQLGEREGGQVELRAGLQEGERVALGAAFLLDSESRLQAALSALLPAAGPPAAPTVPPTTPPAADHAHHHHADGGAARP